MTALNRKLLRDLSRLTGQLVTIALVVACGIASWVAMRSTFDSLLFSRDTYYAAQRFGDVFVRLERAPSSVAPLLEAVPGVAQVYPRVVGSAMVAMPDMPRPASATVVSVPRDGVPPLCGIHLIRGRTLDPTRADETLVLEAFATAHGLQPGDALPAVINGTLRELQIVGIAMSPEFVMTMPAGGLTFDPKQVTVLWMNRDVVEAAYGLDGGFNDVVARMQPGADPTAVKASFDDVLAPYGGVGAIGRDKQPSNYMLQGEIDQLENMATVVPFIFLFVAAFLLNVVLSRLVTLQRGQIATLKAVGYDDRAIGLHYLQLVSVIVLVGTLLGLATGVYLGEANLSLYTDEFFRFPEPRYRLGVDVAVGGIAVSLGAAVVGAMSAVRRVAAMPPAEAMRPPAPVSYNKTPLERLGLFRWLSPATKMVLREVQRRPLRLLLSAFAISMAIGILVVSRFMVDAIEVMFSEQIHKAMREDINVVLARPLPERTVREIEHFPGVFRAEGMRSVAVRFRVGHRFRDAVINGYPADGDLRRLVDRDNQTHRPPDDGGLLVTSKLAEILGVEVGDSIDIELREGDRKTHRIAVAGLVDESFGLQGHMRTDALHRLLSQTEAVNAVVIAVDPLRFDDVTRRLKEQPWVVGVSSPRDFRERFDESSGEMMTIFTVIMTTFATIIAVGVIYNNTRVALSQRSRDLASLRVLGFSRSEIARILLGEQAIQVALAIPLGLAVGTAMTFALMTNADPETYRLPVVISARTYVHASIVGAAAALASALLVRRKLDKLDLIGVLKTRE